MVSKVLGVKGAELDVSIAFGLLHGTSPRFSDDGKEEYADRPFYARGTLALTSEAARSRGKVSVRPSLLDCAESISTLQ